mmetsp:Transcript_3648/g.6909  ORF Transcript_3648/g.6909 Transcript_3648/m.6909 type:complete len:207 (+) Transcript_3648:727-1347(+)
MNTMCASLIFSKISSLDSSAAILPASGLAPHPSPAVTLWPICSLLSVSVVERCCASVLTARNSTPERLLAIMLLTAFPPAPPTPMTTILGANSAKLACMAGASNAGVSIFSLIFASSWAMIWAVSMALFLVSRVLSTGGETGAAGATSSSTLTLAELILTGSLRFPSLVSSVGLGLVNLTFLSVNLLPLLAESFPFVESRRAWSAL